MSILQNKNRRILLGTDWWTDCDDVAALRMMCRMAKRGVWTPDGVILNAAAPYAAASLLAILRDEGFGDVPVGIDIAADDFGGRPPYQYAVAKKAGAVAADTTPGTLGTPGTPGRPIPENAALVNGVTLYRQMLACAADGSMELLEIGYLQVLAALLSSPPDECSPLDGIALVKTKVRRIWCMAGNWQEGGHGKENNFCRNARARRAAHAVLRDCPVPVTFLGWEVGATVIAHPKEDPDDLVRIAFEAHSSPDGRSAWDPLLVLLAAHDVSGIHDAGFRAVSGRASVDAETGENFFEVKPGGSHAYVIKTMPDAWYEKQVDAWL